MTEDSSYYVSNGPKVFYVTSSELAITNFSMLDSVMGGKESGVKGTELYRIGVADYNSAFIIMMNYGDVVFTFTQPPSSFSE